MLPNRLDSLRFEGKVQLNANCMGEIKEGDWQTGLSNQI